MPTFRRPPMDNEKLLAAASLLVSFVSRQLRGDGLPEAAAAVRAAVRRRCTNGWRARQAALLTLCEGLSRLAKHETDNA